MCRKQVLYNLQNREIEFDLLPWSHPNKIPIMAYSPAGHSGALLKNSVLKKIGTAHDATPAQIALAWVLRHPEVIAIPKASNEAHVRDNAGSPEIKLTKEDLTDLDREFPPPKSKRPLPGSEGPSLRGEIADQIRLDLRARQTLQERHSIYLRRCRYA